MLDKNELNRFYVDLKKKSVDHPTQKIRKVSNTNVNLLKILVVKTYSKLFKVFIATNTKSLKLLL